MNLGVVGGGQLGRMLALAAAPLGIKMTVLDPTPGCPAAVAADQILGSLEDAAAIARLAAVSDILTVEIEHCNVDALEEAAARGVPVHPAPAVLRTVADKLAQRRTLAAAGLPVPRFAAIDDADTGASPGRVASAAVGGGNASADRPELTLEEFVRVVVRDTASGSPVAVQKARFGGYDGRGVALVDGATLGAFADTESSEIDSPGGGQSTRDNRVALPITAPSYLEQLVPIAVEVSVIVARATDGSTVAYDPIEMVMDTALNLVDAAIAPARIAPEVATRCTGVARAAAEALAVVGLLAVELFVTKEGGVLINEVAPRVHNSGHLTIEACVTSQFEQHLRAVSGLPLGSPRLIRPTVMRNIVAVGSSDRGFSSDHIGRALAVEEIHLHLYGKETAHPGRKMGHFTAGGSSIEEALDRIEEASRLLGVRPEE